MFSSSIKVNMFGQKKGGPLRLKLENTEGGKSFEFWVLSFELGQLKTQNSKPKT